MKSMIHNYKKNINMSKGIILGAIAVLFAFSVNAQELPINKETGKVTFMEVKETGDVKATEAYDVIKKWSAGKGLTVTKDEGGKLFYTAKHKVNYPAVRGSISNEGKVDYILQFFFKDGKVRYIMTDFVHSGKLGSGGKMENAKPIDGYGKVTERAWNMIRDQTFRKSNKVVTSFTKAITEFQNDPARSDDW